MRNGGRTTRRCAWFAVLGLAGAVHAGEVVRIHLQENAGVERKDAAISGGIPLPKGLVKEAERIGLERIPVQKRVLSRWSDGSIKWVLLDFKADLAAGGRAEQIVTLDADAKNPPDMPVTETDDELVVDTGALKFAVSKRRFEFIREAWLDLDGDGTYADSEHIVRPSARQDFFFDVQANAPVRERADYAIRNLKTGFRQELTGSYQGKATSKPTLACGSQWVSNEAGGAETRVSARTGTYEAQVVERGPVRTVVRLKGTLGADAQACRYTIWIHAYAGQAALRIQHSFVFAADPQKTFIRRMGLSLPLEFEDSVKFAAAGLNDPVACEGTEAHYLHASGPRDVFHLQHGGLVLPWKVQAGSTAKQGDAATGGWIEATGARFGVTLACRDMAMLYPKELSYAPRDRTLTAWLWPDHGGEILDMRASGWPDGMQGVGFTHDWLLDFHKPGAQAPAQAAAAFNAPLRLYANPEWYGYQGTRAAGMLMPYAPERFPKTEAYLAVGTAFIERSRIEFGWLGLLNYGDLLWAYNYEEWTARHKANRPYDGTLGTWGLAERPDDYGGWRHGNTMVSTRMYNQYLRTGQEYYLHAADAHLIHVRDVLIKHVSTEHSRSVGLGRRHSAYWGVGPEYDQKAGVAMDGYGTNWLGLMLHWNLSGDWRTYEVLNEVRISWNFYGNTIVAQPAGSAYLGLKLLSQIPGYEAAGKEAEAFVETAYKYASEPTDDWRDATWFLGYGLYLPDFSEDRVIREKIIAWWKARRKPDGLYWNRDAAAAVYWAAEHAPEIRKEVVEELAKFGSLEQAKSEWAAPIEKQVELFKKYGLEGLLKTCPMQELGAHFAPGYYRAKDDIEQIQWDEPLGMAVLDHARTQSQGK